MSVRVSGSLQSNLGEPLVQAAMRGHGISMHPTYTVADELKARRLQWVLPEHEPRGFDISVVYPTRQHLPLRVRKLLGHLKDWARTPPEWTRIPPRAVPRRTPRPAASRRR